MMFSIPNGVDFKGPKKRGASDTYKSEFSGLKPGYLENPIRIFPVFEQLEIPTCAEAAAEDILNVTRASKDGKSLVGF